MKRLPKFVASGALLALTAGPALAQPGQGQEKSPVQGQNPGLGQAQNPNPAQTQVQGKAQITNQPGSQQGMVYGGINQNPWFGDKTVQEQLKINGDQTGALNKAYGEAYTNYNNGVSQLGKTLNEQQRAQKMQELQATFNQNLNRSVDGVIIDPQQRQRFNQLNLQYQGYSAFNDPTLQQKLNLTPEQRQKFTQYGQEWNQQMGMYNQQYQTDPQGTIKLYNNMGKQTNERFNSVLNPQQQQMWRQMTGESYNFPPTVYFQSNGNVNERPRN